MILGVRGRGGGLLILFLRRRWRKVADLWAWIGYLFLTRLLNLKFRDRNVLDVEASQDTGGGRE